MKQDQKAQRDTVGAKLEPWPKSHGHRAGLGTHCQYHFQTVSAIAGHQTLQWYLCHQKRFSSCLVSLHYQLLVRSRQKHLAKSLVHPLGAREPRKEDLTRAVRDGLCLLLQLMQWEITQTDSRQEQKNKRPHGPSLIHDSCFSKLSTTSLSP